MNYYNFDYYFNLFLKTIYSISPIKNPTEILTTKQINAVVKISRKLFLLKFLKETRTNKKAV